MNVLFIGPYKQRDGWGHAARAYVKSLIASGLNLTIRPIFMNMDKKVEDCPEFEEYENKVYDSYDVVIQNVLPHLFRRNEGVVNIGLAYFESDNLQCTPWPMSINQMDQMWVSSTYEQDILKNSGVTIPVHRVPIACDPLVYQKDYEFNKLKDHDHEYKFYFIGEYISRKSIDSLIVAFHREFHPNENVRLVLKLNKVGMSDFELFNGVSGQLQHIKTNMGMYRDVNMYKQEMLVCNHMPVEELYGFHQSCDCFVVPSYGEAFCMPAFDAMAFGNDVIVGQKSGVTDYVDGDLIGHTVNSYEVPAISSDRSLPFLYNGRDTWWKIDVIDLQRKMREAYSGSVNADNYKEVVSRYSYDVVGQTIRGLL